MRGGRGFGLDQEVPAVHVLHAGAARVRRTAYPILICKHDIRPNPGPDPLVNGGGRECIVESLVVVEGL